MVGKAEEAVDLPQRANAIQAIKTAIRGEKEAYENIFEKDGSLKQYVLVMRNGVNVSTPKDLAEPLNEGDLIQLLPTVSGGRPHEQS